MEGTTVKLLLAIGAIVLLAGCGESGSEPVAEPAAPTVASGRVTTPSVESTTTAPPTTRRTTTTAPPTTRRTTTTLPTSSAGQLDNRELAAQIVFQQSLDDRWPGLGDRYRRSPDSFHELADATCDVVARSRTAEDVTAAVAVAWINLSPDIQSDMYDDPTEMSGLFGMILGSFCPDQLDHVTDMMG